MTAGSQPEANGSPTPAFLCKGLGNNILLLSVWGTKWLKLLADLHGRWTGCLSLPPQSRVSRFFSPLGLGSLVPGDSTDLEKPSGALI